DEISLDSVIANVTYPNGTLLQQLTDQNVDFTFVPANLTALGRYNITVFANDTSDNTNTSTDFFYVNDTVAPTIDISVNATDVEYSIESVLIDFNASNGFLDSVIANVTYPNGTLLQQLTDQNVDFIFEPANLTALGRYNITVFANDTSGNTNTSESFFYVNDTVAPTIDISVNATDVEYSIESVLIDFNASNGLLDSVIANITYPNGTLLQQLTDQSIDFVFAPANLTSIGRYNITVFANDTSGNTNTSTSFFNVNDTFAPEINISVNDTYVQNGTESVRIDFNASDANLDSVIANVTYPNGTLLQQLTNQAVDFEFGPDNLTEFGQYNITVFANDTYGNTNISTSYFQVITGPTITIYVNDTSVEFGIESVLIDFNASSNGTIDTIIANVTYPNSTLLQQLTNQSVDFTFEPANLTVLGTYDITVFANDTDGNPNTETSFFDVDDTTPPTWNQTPSNQAVEYNESFSYQVNATDNYQIDKYFINDSTNFAINSDTGLITNATSFTPGILYLNISVNDTSNNIRSTVIQITVQDSTYPVLNITYPVNGSTYYTLNLTLNWTFTDDYPDKCWYNLNNNATNTSIVDCSDLYANFTAVSLAWNNITMWINDTSNNVVAESITFYARTQTAPNVTNVTITPTYNGANVSTLNDMHCNYTYNDIEGDPDQSTIKWFRNSVLTSFTSATIPYQNTSIG
ncbi:MAG: hypothetical protein KAS15_03650, partial [Nanoarchaeota archaeon]|nr:hypothetical protein [Nanoarchaeota archaeon]